MKLQTLPYIDFQPDALEVFQDIAQRRVEQEDVWVSCYQIGETSVHGKIKLNRYSDSDGVELVARGGVEVEQVASGSFKISCPSLKIPPTTLRFPTLTLITPRAPTPLAAPLTISSLSINPQGTHIAYSGPDGYAQVSTVTGKGVVELEGHVGDVNCLDWFPSGQVILTASSDSTLRIFSSHTGSSPRTLKAHKRAITSTAILGIGKLVLSGSKDGSVRLWDVAGGKAVTSLWVEGFAGVESMVVGKGVRGMVEETEGEGEGVGGKKSPGFLTDEQKSIIADTVIFTGLTTGLIQTFHLPTFTTLLPAFPSTPTDIGILPDLLGGQVYALAYDAERGVLVSGTAKGVVTVRDTRKLSSPGGGVVAVFRRTTAEINALTLLAPLNGKGVDILIASSSGLPCRVNVDLEGGLAVVVEEYAGWEPGVVGCCAAEGEGAGGRVWFGGEGGRVCRY